VRFAFIVIYLFYPYSCTPEWERKKFVYNIITNKKKHFFFNCPVRFGIMAFCAFSPSFLIVFVLAKEKHNSYPFDDGAIQTQYKGDNSRYILLSDFIFL